jgi:hypothetical protein
VTDDDEVRRELERVAHTDAASGRALIAKTTALRALDRLNNRRRRKEPPPCPDNWHPQPGSEMEALDATDPHLTPEARRRWFATMWEDGLLDDQGRYVGGASE